MLGRQLASADEAAFMRTAGADGLIDLEEFAAMLRGTAMPADS